MLDQHPHEPCGGPAAEWGAEHVGFLLTTRRRIREESRQFAIEVGTVLVIIAAVALVGLYLWWRSRP